MYWKKKYCLSFAFGIWEYCELRSQFILNLTHLGIQSRTKSLLTLTISAHMTHEGHVWGYGCPQGVPVIPSCLRTVLGCPQEFSYFQLPLDAPRGAPRVPSYPKFSPWKGSWLPLGVFSCPQQSSGFLPCCTVENSAFAYRNFSTVKVDKHWNAFLENLYTLYPWGSSNHSCTSPWATCFNYICFEQEVGLKDSWSPFPTEITAFWFWRKEVMMFISGI